ncbi:MAG TPA: molybdopterin-dependent oxidoreductase [Bryobacteraceae bacterium]
MNDRQREIVLPDGDVKRELRRRTRRSFLIGGLAAAAGFGGYKLVNAGNEGGAASAQRHMLNFNGHLNQAFFSNARLMPTYSPDQVRYLKPNGNLGLQSEIGDWQLNVQSARAATQGALTLDVLALTLDDVKALPKVTMIPRFCCIEGWSTIVQWGGARFSDFTRKYLRPGFHPRYVYMETPDAEYYVGLDMKSALHPQTLLAYEKDWKPLTPDHGAPLRLIIPVKYGIKSIKRIGLIQYTDAKPDDYWADEGYDWYSGL